MKNEHQTLIEVETTDYKVKDLRKVVRKVETCPNNPTKLTELFYALTKSAESLLYSQ